MGEHDGHRKRILKRLDGNFLLEHEYLEILLFNAIPRRNTNDLAHRLLARFGTVQNIFSASFADLCSVDGVGESVASYLCVIGKLAAKYENQKRLEFSSRYDMQKFFSYINERYKKEEKEVIDAYLLDKKGMVFNSYRFTSEEAKRVDLEPAELSAFLLRNQPAGLVIVHNHPHGDASASKKDELLTRKAQVLCSAQNILFCDHLICGENGVYSYYLDGKMGDISKSFSMTEIVGEKDGE